MSKNASMQDVARDALDQAERRLEAARQHSTGGTREELINVGRATEEMLITLGLGLYSAEKHEPQTGPRPGADPIRRLEAYIESELAGPTNEAPRTLAKSSLKTLESLQQMRTTDARTAAWCLEAATSLLRVLRIAAGRTDLDYTIGDLIATFLDSRSLSLGESHRRTLEVISGMEIAKKNASKLTADDLIEFARAVRNRFSAASRGQKVGGSTVTQYITYLRGVFNNARKIRNIPLSIEAFEQAKPWLERFKLVSRAVPRHRRPTDDEIQRLLLKADERERHAVTTISVRDLLEFGLHSGWPLGKICNLKWADEEEIKRRLIQDARDIIDRRKSKKEGDLIFPFNAHSASQAFRETSAAAKIKNFRFQDLRREAAIRLYYKHGKTLDEISRMIGRSDLNSLRRDIEQAAADSASKQPGDRRLGIPGTSPNGAQ